jgi:hypothetical protein
MTTDWTSAASIPTVVQYYVPGSTSYFVAGCRQKDGKVCKASYHSTMHMMVGDWDDKGPMELVEDFTWKGTIDVGESTAHVWFTPHKYEPTQKLGWSIKENIQKSMDDWKLWKGSGEESVLSMAKWATPVKVTPCCRLQAVDTDDDCIPATCDRRPDTKCEVTVNDLTLKIKVLNPLPITQCPFRNYGLVWGILAGTLLLCFCGYACTMKRKKRRFRGSEPALTSFVDEDAGVELNKRLQA